MTIFLCFLLCGCAGPLSVAAPTAVSVQRKAHSQEPTVTSPRPTARPTTIPAPLTLSQPGAIQLRAVKVEPRTTAAGEQVTLYYTIKNRTRSLVWVILGATIESRQALINRYDDPSTDKAVALPPGESVQERQFVVPGQAAGQTFNVSTTVNDGKFVVLYARRRIFAALTVR